MKKKKKKSRTPLKNEGEWTQSKFVESLTRVMKKQEEDNPRLKRVHARMEPEWGALAALIREMMNATDESQEDELIEKIAAHGKKAVYPLIEMLLAFKKLGKKT